jgi:Flp pilus assembly protein TadD
MVESVLADGQAVIGSQAATNRLSPAEVHDLIRQRLGQWATGWGLKPADTHRLAQRMFGHMYAPGEILLPRGVRADCLGLVVRGQVAIHLGERGTVRPVVILLPGCTFGEAMLIEGRPSGATLQALTRCEVRFLRRADLQFLRSRRRLERWTAALRLLIAGSALLLVVVLVTALLLGLPATREAVALVPMSIGQGCHHMGYEECVEGAWQVAANLAPTDPNPLLALGTFSFEQGDIAAAERAFVAAKAVAPDSPETHNNLGLLYAQQGDHIRAIAAFRQALEWEPGVAATEHNLALSLQAIGDFDQALVHYQSALALGHPQTRTLVNMAIAYLETGQPANAADSARQALLHDRALAPAHTVLGAAQLATGHPEEALQSLHQAAALDASSAHAHFYLGLAHKSLDQPMQAIAAFEKALALAEEEAMRVQIRAYLNELYRSEGESVLPSV